MDGNVVNSTEHAPRAIHKHRTVAESFGSDPERYDRTRPGYPNALIERIVADGPGLEVLDVGCGTGIAARQLQAAGCTVLGVEPDARMAEWARQRGLAVEVAAFEGWESAGRMFDAVIAGQSWHWVEPVAGAAKAAAVLRPAGRLTVFRSDPQLPADLADAVATASGRVLPAAVAERLQARPRADVAAMLSAKAVEGVRQAGGFDEPEQWRFEWERFCTRDQWLDGLPTAGFYTQLPPDKLDQLLTDVGAAIDASGGSFTVGYTTTAVTAARTDTARQGNR
jgi:SAM-dependent methyltransferase